VKEVLVSKPAEHRNPILNVFGVPGPIGGASTKIRDLLRMLGCDYSIRVFVRDPGFLKDQGMRKFLREINVPIFLWNDFSGCRGEIALGICEGGFFCTGLARRLKESGLHVVWSNEMMWEFSGETQAVKEGLIDRVLFLSEIQRQSFTPLYDNVDQVIIRNHITPKDFPYMERSNPTFTIGRLSRPDPVKFPMDFPVFYEELRLDDVKFRIQAWDSEMEKKFSWHRFDSRWEFLKPNKIPAAKFLQSLDLFLYPLGHQFVESWGRVVAEAMLTGCVPVVPSGHQFHNIFRHGEHGFICNNFDEYREVVHELHDHASLRREMGRKAADYARYELFDHEKHKQMWIDALTFD
jgi:glycosyltransferase involved in cell wall biosynthesis